MSLVLYILHILEGPSPLQLVPPSTLPIVDILRTDIYRSVYLDQNGTLTASHSLGTNSITLYTQLTNQILSTPITTYTDSGNTRTYNLTKGNYTFKFSGTTAATITYQSDPYTCPQFININGDVNNIFEPCHLITYTD